MLYAHYTVPVLSVLELLLVEFLHCDITVVYLMIENENLFCTVDMAFHTWNIKSDGLTK